VQFEGGIVIQKELGHIAKVCTSYPMLTSAASQTYLFFQRLDANENERKERDRVKKQVGFVYDLIMPELTHAPTVGTGDEHDQVGYVHLSFYFPVLNNSSVGRQLHISGGR